MRGGKRQGAGRRHGAVNKLTAASKETIARVAGKGITPLEFMLDTMRDETKDFAQRFDAAKNAAPYLHPRLAAIEHSGDKEKPVAYRILTGVPRPSDPVPLLPAPEANDDDISATAH